MCIYAHKSLWNHYIKVNNTQHFPLPVWCLHVHHPCPVFKQHPSILCFSGLVFLSLELIQIKTMLLSEVLSLTTIIMPFLRWHLPFNYELCAIQIYIIFLPICLLVYIQALLRVFYVNTSQLWIFMYNSFYGHVSILFR